MSKTILSSSALLLAFLALTADATFVRLDSSAPLCFAEDVSAQSEIVVIEYDRPSVSVSNVYPVKIKATSPYSKSVVYDGNIRVGKSSFTFKPVSTESGEYDICLSISSEHAKQLAAEKSYIEVGIIIDHHSRRLSLSQPEPDITRTRVGKGSAVMSFTDRDGNQMETLRSIEFIHRLGALLSDARHAVRDIDDEIGYIMARGSRMRITSESLFSRVWTFAALTMIAMVAVGYMQFKFLTSFLKRKKLV